MIDLGDVAAPAAHPIEPRPRSARQARLLRLGFVVALVCALVRTDTAVAASSPMQLQGYLPVLLPPASLLIADGRAIVLSKNGRQLTAYAIPGGGALWSAAVQTNVGPAQVGPAQVFTMGSIVIVNPSPQLATGDVEAIDLITGRVLWHRPAYGAARIGSALLTVNVDGSTVPSPSHLARIDPETGRTIWTSRQPYDCGTSFGDDDSHNDRMIGFCYTTNQLTVADLSTGAVLTSRHVELGGGDALIPAGGSIVVEAGDDVNRSLTAYSINDLELLWSGLPTAPDALVQACGDYLCVESKSAGLWLVDPHTGVRLPAARTPIAGPSPDVALNAHEDGVVRVGQLAALSKPDADPADLGFAVEQATPLGQAVELPVYMAGTPVTWIAEQTFIDGVVGYRPIGELYGVGIGCRYIGAYVACMTARQRLGLWLIKPLE